jgi:hypothetical protein
MNQIDWGTTLTGLGILVAIIIGIIQISQGKFPFKKKIKTVLNIGDNSQSNNSNSVIIDNNPQSTIIISPTPIPLLN